MEAPEPENEKKGLTDILDQSIVAPPLDSKKSSSLGMPFAALTLISLFSLFSQSDKVHTPNSSAFNPRRYISDLVCSPLLAQQPDGIYTDNLALLLYDPKEAGKMRLMLTRGDTLIELTPQLYSKGLVSVEDIYLGKSSNIICSALDTTDAIDNWEIVRVAPNGKVASLTNTSGLDESSPSMSNDQNKLAYAADGSVFVECSGKKIRLNPKKGMAYTGVRWTPEDRLVVIVEEGKKSYIAEIDPENPLFVYRLTHPENTIHNIVISPDGKNLIYVRNNTEIVIADRFGNSPRILSSGSHPSYPDSATILFTSKFGSNSQIFFTDASGIQSETAIPALMYYPGLLIHSVSSYTPYIIPPSGQKESGINENSESNTTQPASGHNTSKGYMLSKNYPNPFNPATTIPYEIPFNQSGRENVKLEVFDIRGKLVRTLVDGQKLAGRYSVEFDAGGLSSGVYFYKMIVGNFVQTKKMVLLK